MPGAWLGGTGHAPVQPPVQGAQLLQLAAAFFSRFADRHLIVHGVLTHFVAVWADRLKYKVSKIIPFSNCVFFLAKFCFFGRTALF